MTSYISPPFETDPDDIVADALDYLSANMPGFVPSDGHLEMWMIPALADIVATATDVASAVPTSIFRYYGQNIIGLQPLNDTAATITTTWTMVNNAGYTIPTGTQVGWAVAGDTYVPFVTTAPVVIPPGSTSTAAGAVILTAVETGSDSNHLGPGAMVLLDPLAYVSSVVATAASSGGDDAEDDGAYIQRLAAVLQTMTPRPILAKDFAIIARNIMASGSRATAVDNYNPADGTTTNQRMVAVAAVHGDGTTLSTFEKSQLQIYLNQMREVNFIVNVFDPSFYTIDVLFNFTLDPDSDATIVKAAAEAAVTDFLKPSTWGVAGDDKLSWVNTNVVRYNDVIAVLYAIDGLKSVTSLTINGAATDHTMSGVVSLPTVGTITGTAV